MQCPACARELTTMTAGPVTVDACVNGCGGVWFDRGELRHFDEPSEAVPAGLLDVSRDPAVTYDHAQKLLCPACGVPMQRHYSSPKRQVMVDECPGCGGMWLDAGELGGVRGEFESEQARESAESETFQELFGGELSSELASEREKTERAKRVAYMLRFICPSYYIPGKQEGAAF